MSDCFPQSDPSTAWQGVVISELQASQSTKATLAYSLTVKLLHNPFPLKALPKKQHTWHRHNMTSYVNI